MTAHPNGVRTALGVAFAIVVLVGVGLLVAPGVDPQETAHARAVSLCAQTMADAGDVPRCAHAVEAALTEDDR